MSTSLENAAVSSGLAAQQDNKFLTFQMDGEGYGIEILRIQEIIGLQPMIKIPRLPAYLRGVINLRGRIIPTIDLRLKFGLPGKEDTERTCIIVTEASMGQRMIQTGLIVDEVAEVVNIPKKDIRPTAEVIADNRAEVINGFGLVGGKVKLLLDISKVLTGGEMKAIRGETSGLEGVGNVAET